MSVINTSSIAVILYLSLFGSIQAQIVIDTSYTAEKLVKEVFLGEGVVAGNVRMTGSTSAIGYFQNTIKEIGIAEGILLTSGNVFLVQSPNYIKDAGWVNGGSGDVHLESLTRGRIYDPMVLEFDFITSSDKLTFNYIFGSEEYPEYVDSRYNDVFGFFISGPGFNDVNLAQLPGTDIPISINNINHKRNKNFYLDNTYLDTREQFIWDPRKRKVVKNKDFGKKEVPAPYAIQYDGLTRRLSIDCKLIPNEVYHIKLAIADVSDPILDSGVMLEAKSFSSNGKKVIELDPEFFENILPPRDLVADIHMETIPKVVKPEINEVPTLKKENVAPDRKLITLKHVVEFEFDCYEPTDSARLVINNVARIMKSDPTLNLFLIGHTDDFGSDEYNLKLSKLRSQSIFQELIVSGLDRSRIMLDYFGEKKPVAPNSTSIGRARNRRVEIWFQ